MLETVSRHASAFLAAIFTITAAWAVPADQRVGVGDSRVGYETDAYVTDSRVLVPDGTGQSFGTRDVASPPLGLPAVPVPETSPLTNRRINLGRTLFFDRRLSFNGTLSCGMCHVPEQGFAQNELRTPVGAEGRFVRRNAPSLYNVGYRQVLFHDGRETSLENQIWAPLLAFNEMANPSIGSVLNRIAADTDYVAAFDAAFSRGLTMETLGMALASYERLLVSGNSRFDRWYYGGEESALGAAEARGFSVFQTSGCTGCHLVGPSHAQFTDDAFHDTGTAWANAMLIPTVPETVQIAPGVAVPLTSSIATPPRNDLGRYEATGITADRWKIRTPTLRNVAVTGPYMHDGSLATLEDVVAFYNRGGVPHDGLDPRVRPLNLSGRDQAALVAFLKSLTGDNIEQLAVDARTTRIGN